MNDSPSNLFPALRAKMGDRWYYVTTFTLSEVAQWIKPVDQIHERKELKTWIQRVLRSERKEEIATYLLNQEQRFFNAIVVGIYGGDPEWLPVEVGDSPTLKEIKLGQRQSTAFGFLQLSGNEEIFAIDGQHRVEGIRQALSENEALKDDELTVIFVAHKSTVEGRERTRRLFTTLNKYAKPVSPAELIALNDDDAFAIVTRRLIESYQGLQSEFVPLVPTANIPAGNETAFTTVISLYELVKTISIPAGSKERKLLEKGPPNWARVDEIYDTVVLFWDAVQTHVPPVRKVFRSLPDKKLAADFRIETGGHLMFRSAGLQGFARAARALVDHGEKLQVAVRRLADCPLDLSAKPWIGVLWNPSAMTMIVKNKKLVVNLFLHMVGEKPVPSNYDLLAQYRRATGIDNERLPRRHS